MKSTIKLFGIIALMAVIGFSMTACKTEEDAGTPYTIYRGSGYKPSLSGGGGSTEYYALKIMGNNKYELSTYFNSSPDELFPISSGIVTQKLDTTYYLKPSNSAAQLTATVSSAGLVELLGTILDSGGSPITFPTTLNPAGVTTGTDKPKGGGGGEDNPVGGGGGPVQYDCNCDGVSENCNCSNNYPGYCECDVCEEQEW